MFQVSSKKSFIRLATAAIVLGAVGSTILLPSQANAILSTGEFTFNNPGSIQGLKFLYANRQGSDSDFNVNFSGTWPYYQTDTVSWVACPDGKGTSCSSPSGVGHTGMSVNCTGVIKLAVKSDDGTQGELSVTESGLGETSGDSFDCKAAISENATVTLKNPISAATTNREADRKAREATLTTYCQQLNQEQGAPPSALSGCVATMTAAFNTCYDALGGGNGGTEKEVTIQALTKCIAAATNSPEGALTAALSKAPPNNIQPGTVAADGAVGDATTSCRIDGIGWIICPVMGFMAKIVDAAYTVVASLLVVQPILSTGGDTTVFKAWEVMRNIANVAFVITFLIIIFSQLTSVGISNYGVKKMLPRLVAAAILVNISFWVCSIAVDLSNIIGGSVNDLFHMVATTISNPAQGNNTIADDLATGSSGWSQITGSILAGGAIAAGVLYIGLSALVPALIVALLAIVTVFIVLTVRQALIILLIVISPLAFVAFLLPNTESLFKKWKSLFTTMLLMFPIIGMMFGAAALASVVITQTATQQSNEGLKIAIQVMGALIAIVPLVLTPLVMKAAGGVLGKVGAFVNNPNKGPFDRAKKGAEGYRKNRQQLRDSRALNGGSRFGGSMVRRKAERKAVLEQRGRNYNTANAQYISDTALSDKVSTTQQALSKVSGGKIGGNTEGQQLLNKMSNGGGAGAQNSALANAISVNNKLEAEEVTAANAIIQNAKLDLNQMLQLAKGETVTDTGLAGGVQVMAASKGSALQTAAIQNTFKTGDVSKTDQLVGMSGGMGDSQMRAVADGASSQSGKVNYYGGDTSDQIIKGNINSEADLNKQVEKVIDGGKISEQSLASQDKDALARLSNVAVNGNADASKVAALKQVAEDLRNNSELYPTVENRKKDRILAIEHGVVHP